MIFTYTTTEKHRSRYKIFKKTIINIIIFAKQKYNLKNMFWEMSSVLNINIITFALLLELNLLRHQTISLNYMNNISNLYFFR